MEPVRGAGYEDLVMLSKAIRKPHSSVIAIFYEESFSATVSIED